MNKKDLNKHWSDQTAKHSESAQQVSVLLKLVAPDGKVRASSTTDTTLRAGQQEAVASLDKPFATLQQPELDDLIWYRLAYEIRKMDGEMLASGIIPLGTARSDFFRLAVASARMAGEGRRYWVRVNAAHPNTLKPMRGIEITGEITLDGEDAHKITSKGITDAQGDAVLEFPLPMEMTGPNGTLRVSGHKGLLIRSVEQDIQFWPVRRLLIDTDKDIYQPGQTLHVRALMFLADRSAAPGAKLDIKITDESNSLVFRDTQVTDSFGVIHADWPISSNLRLGNYMILVTEADKDESHAASAAQSVHIYRYDLPNFSVTTKPDHSYYLSGQNAEITVAADYLFGKPVTRGSVRVVEEQERKWNFHDQKWDIKENQVVTGELDKNGRFTARLDLNEYHENLKGDTHRLFQDVNVAAYVTDLTTGRTEQRRFTVRVTREPIHVYVSESRDLVRGLPANFFVSAFYADGTPARCSLRVSTISGDKPEKTQRFLLNAKTNKYGLAKLSNLPIGDDASRDSLLVEASDVKGFHGSHVQGFSFSEQDSISIGTDHNIYKPGDPVEVFLQATKPDMKVVVDVLRNDEAIASQTVTMKHGKASVFFPYDKRFSDDMGIFAYALNITESSNDVPSTAKGILFPKNRRLDTKIHFEKPSYRPGEAATAHFTVQMPGGEGAESSLGLKVVDRAVEERSRTDREFSDEQYRYWRWSLWSADVGFAGVTRDDLDLIDLSQPIPDDLDLVLEYMFSPASFNGLRIDVSNGEHDAQSTFSRLFDLQFQELKKTLDESDQKGSLPRYLEPLIRLGQSAGISVLDLKDPWGTPYRYSFEYVGSREVLKVHSAGVDKQFGTKDDFVAREYSWDYFGYDGQLINKTTADLLEQQGNFIRDHDALRQALQSQVDIDALRDPWGNPFEYRFEIEHSEFVIYAISGGPKWDGRAPIKPQDEIRFWRSSLDYFTKARKQIEQVVYAYIQRTGLFPENQVQLAKVLAPTGVDLEALRDPWGEKYYAIFKSAPNYGDHIVIRQQGQIGERTTTPVTLVRRELILMSAGYDRKPNTSDDFSVAYYSAVMSQQSAEQEQPQETPTTIVARDAGVISGTVLDPQGAVIAGSAIVAKREGDTTAYQTLTDSVGMFTLSDLPAGVYSIEARKAGFLVAKVMAVVIKPSYITEISITLSVGSSLTEITVEGTSPLLQTNSTELSAVISRPTTGSSKVGTTSSVMSTPRLREYFPETLLWEPSLVTDRKGHAKLNFKLAYNITTWKLSAIASTRSGELGRAEMDLRAFQPFFLEHDPPRILTEGDVIDYPVVLRNYLDKRQTVTVSMKPESWFSVLSPLEQRVTIDSGDATNATFRYRAIAAIDGGKQQVSAANTTTSDAAEKPLDVHPFGRLESKTDTQLIGQSAVLRVQVPDNLVANSINGELKVYPNLMAHVIESIEAVLESPHGCGEQTISSTYPSLLVAQFYQSAGEHPPVVRKARRYLQSGYDRLLGYQDPSGGFTYWGHGDPDLALTAYALNFLGNAAQIIDVDPTVIDKANNWLAGQQQPNGSWRTHSMQDDSTTPIETAYIARTLAEAKQKGNKPSGAAPDATELSLNKALKFLETHRDASQEPYTIASYALATMASVDKSAAKNLIEQLRRSVHHEGDTSYWALETNTPLNSWGQPGVLESTALAVRALTRYDAESGVPGTSGNASNTELINEGLLYLLRNKDRYGIWYSGQTTVNVLETLLSLRPKGKHNGGSVTVIVNGHKLPALTLPPDDALVAPLQVDLKNYLKPSNNQVELEMVDTSSPISAQFLTNYYVPWDNNAPANGHTQNNSSLKLTVDYSNTRANAGETIACHVHAERIGFRGYGMILGEIGLPPGVDVDRESLENATSNWSLDHYDVLPDRVIVYLWPRAGGTDFTFKFRLRFPIDAETAPSDLYDYYNPDSSVVLKPTHFERTELIHQPQ